MAVLIVDAGPLVAIGDRRDPNRAAVQRVLRSTRDDLVVAAPVTQEVDYLLGKFGGPDAQAAFLSDLAEQTFVVACLEPQEYHQIGSLARRYIALRPGLADLANVVLAARFGTTRIITFDQRHFRAMRPLQGGAFTLLPWDQE